jgi:endogenous inhibitor of DNA gyrase (YacG/DUF329 family)
MTQQHKDAIRQMRIGQMSYRQIAAALGISENTIKTFCQRNNLGGVSGSNTIIMKEAPNFVCRQCGRALPQARRGKPRKFCSDACRRTWWKQNGGQLKRKAYHSAICACCGQPFVVYGSVIRKYCSHGCYINDRFKSENCRPIVSNIT